MPNAASSKQDKRLRNLRSCMFCTLFCITIGVSGQQRGTQLPHPQVPDDNAPNTKSAHHQMPTNEVNEKLRKEFDPKNAAYAGSSIQAAVDDQSISLTGTVKSRIQHEMALQLARAYAGDRKIIDRWSCRSNLDDEQRLPESLAVRTFEEPSRFLLHHTIMSAGV
jgi:hypothetical protein